MTSSINHHINDATLMAYSAGSLSTSLNFVVATHLSMCATCRAKLEQFDTIGAANLNDLPVVSMNANALENVMALIDADNSHIDDLASVQSANQNGLPNPLAQYLPEGLDGIKWKTMAPGIKTYAIPEVNVEQGSLRLLKIAPGITIPEHTHTGGELTLVLRGSFQDEIGRFCAGDLADLDEDNHHQPIADTHEDCICLIATEGPLKFKSMMPKIMQYFVGM